MGHGVAAIGGGGNGECGGERRGRRGSVLNDVDLSQTSLVVDLVDLAVGDGVLVLLGPLALARGACGCYGQGWHCGEEPAGSSGDGAVDRRVVILGRCLQRALAGVRSLQFGRC